MDGDVAGTALPASRHHPSRANDRVTPSPRAANASAALSSKTGSFTQIPSPRPSAEKPRELQSTLSLILLFLHGLPSPLLTFKVPTDSSSSFLILS